MSLRVDRTGLKDTAKQPRSSGEGLSGKGPLFSGSASLWVHLWLPALTATLWCLLPGLASVTLHSLTPPVLTFVFLCLGNSLFTSQPPE